MEAEWANVSLDLRPYKQSSEVAVISTASAETVQVLVDEHYARTSTMLSSRYAQSFAKRLSAWLGTLSSMQSALDVWLQAQVTWASLEPIFSSAGMVEALPEEARQFQSIDARWRKLQRTSLADPRAMAMLRQPGALATLTAAQTGMEAVMSGLRAFLEGGGWPCCARLRSYIPRDLYFVGRQARDASSLLLPFQRRAARGAG